MISTDREDVQRFAVCSREECYYLQSSDRTDFAVMHSRTATALQTLQDLKSLRFEAILTGGDLTKPHQVSKEGKKTVFAISITIYGPDDVSQEVGKRLSRVRTYLQHPICVRKDVPYNNPHFYVITGVQKAETQYISPSSEKEDQQTPLVDISKVLEEIEQARRLPSLDVDWRVKTPLLEYAASSRSITPDWFQCALRLDTKKKPCASLSKERRRVSRMNFHYGRHRRMRMEDFSESSITISPEHSLG